MENVTVVGLGAIGSIYAAAFSQTAGVDLKVAVDEQRVEKYKSEPLVFNGQEFDFQYFTPKVGDAKSDLIIIATKSLHYHQALKMIEPIVGPNTIILPLLNGITSEDIASQYFGWDKLLYGYWVGNASIRVGRSVEQDGKYVTCFGEKLNVEPYSDKVLKVKGLFDRAGIKYRIDGDMISSKWQKFILNIGTNQPSAMFKYTYGDMCDRPEAMEFAKNLMREGVEIAMKLGVAEADEMFERSLEIFKTIKRDLITSMYQDVLAGRETEVDIFGGEIVRLGAKVGVPTPYNQKVVDYFSNQSTQ